MCFGTIQDANQFYQNYAKRVCLDHSHLCDPEMAKLLTRNREMSMHMCRVIERNDEAGVRPSKTYQVLVGEAGGFSKINLMEKDVKNYLSRKLRNVTQC
ncbi:hypothetical protein AHAS_Ahas04G0133000 [Arachis hypogaea]